LKKIGLVLDPRFLDYPSERFSLENPERLLPLYHRLLRSGDWYERIEPRPATVEEIALVHDGDYILEVKNLSEKGGGAISPDTFVPPGGFETLALAAGGVMEAVKAVLEGRVKQAFVLSRPPGHHAGRNRGMGFCIFNHVAIGASYALHRGASRLAIVDWDVHHGNGTQEIFYSDPRVLYFSIHQYPLFPDSGYFDEVGEGPGEGFTVNLPLPLGARDNDYANAFRHLLIPLLERHSPDLILVSAGFDAHHLDPLGEMFLTERGFKRMTDLLLKAARHLCDERVVFVLEGGHHPEALYRSVMAVMERCDEGMDLPEEEFLREEEKDYPKVKPFLDSAREQIGRYWGI